MNRVGPVLLILLSLVTACLAPTTAIPTSTPTIQVPTATWTPTSTSTPTPSPMPTRTPTPRPTATLTPTPDPYAGLTIADLAARAYGGGEITVERVLGVTAAFTRTLITYPSDGLTIYGFMNVPQGEGPFPVALVLHGYVDPERYATLTYTTRYADALARAGYLVIHPNLRNFPPSDEGPDPFRVGLAIDVLNLMALVREQSGQAGPLSRADAERLGLWGHSMGGGVTLRVITVDPDVDAAVLYGAMSGDEYQNYEKILQWSDGESGEEELATPPEDMERIAPIHHLRRIEAAVSIHHGTADATVPPVWSDDLCDQLEALDKPVECFSYEGFPHTFSGTGDATFIVNTVDFFDRYLK